MIKLLNYNLNSDYESNKEQLKQLDNYLALTEDNQMIHFPNIFYVTTNNSGTTIYKRTDNQDGKETVKLENGENKLNDWNYGFYFNYGIKQDQITSFDLSKYDTSNVTNMSSMFYYCRSLTSLDVANFDTSKVTSMGGMFIGCSGLTSLHLSNFDTTNVTNISSMFFACTRLTSLNLSNFDTSNVTNMTQMFYNCYNLTSLDLSNFDTTNVINMDGMFDNCNKLTHIKCKQAFKDWCITNQIYIKLPDTMRDGGSGQWEIVE